MGLKLRRSELNIDLVLGSNADLAEQLHDFKLDAMLVALDDAVVDAGCESVELFSDDIFLAAPSDSPFADQAEVDLRDLAGVPFVTLTQGFATFRDGRQVFAQAGFEPEVIMQVNDIFSLMSMVSSGVGYALLPGRVEAVYQNRLKLLPLAPRYRLQQRIGAVFLRSRERDPNLLAFVAECRMYARN